MTTARAQLAAATIFTLALIPALVTSVLGAPGTHGLGPKPAGVAQKWGWVTIILPTSSYVPAGIDRGNSAGHHNSVAYSATGHYVVTFTGIGGPGGIAHASPIASTGKVCSVVEWYEAGADEKVAVDCFAASGDPSATRLVVTYLAEHGIHGRLAYLWSDAPGDTDHDADPNYSYNSKEGVNSIHRNSLGDYLVKLPGLASQRGDVQVTAYGSEPEWCNATGWYPESGALYVNVTCYEMDHGTPTDSKFDLTFMQGLGLKGYGGNRVAYVWANKPGAASYTPHPDFRYSSAGTAPHVDRLSTGRYQVTLQGMPKGGGAIVTAYSSGQRCTVASIHAYTLPQKVGVRCFDNHGDPVDSKFQLAYER